MKSKCFSLIELMVVISVILILAGISFPIMASIINTAREKKAKSQMTMMGMAMESYRSDYKVLPFTSTYVGSDVLVNADAGGTGYLTLIAALSGQAGGSEPRRGNYLTPDPKTGGYADPWDSDFWIALDLDYDGTILSNKVYGTSDVVANYYIWCKGRDGLHNPVDGDPTNEDNLTP